MLSTESLSTHLVKSLIANFVRKSLILEWGHCLKQFFHSIFVEGFIKLGGLEITKRLVILRNVWTILIADKHLYVLLFGYVYNQ